MKKGFLIKGLILIIIFLLVGSNVKSYTVENEEEDLYNNCAGYYHRQYTSEEIAAIQKQAEIEGWTFQVGDTGANRRSMDELCGLVLPEEDLKKKDDKKIDTKPKSLGNSGLPSRFYWDEAIPDGLPPVRDQGQCGSCWAFATMGPIEINIKRITGYNVDLSEQWLVSCNQDVTTSGRKWGCRGGWWAHDYFLEDPVYVYYGGRWYYRNDSCGDTGAVTESEFPYTSGGTGEDGDCECPYSHPYFIEDWEWVDVNNDEPSVEDIKQAIYQHGPVSVAICVHGYFIIYEGGVYNYEYICVPGIVNHGVTLVGWDDSQGQDGVWYLRNSWGTDWGESATGIPWYDSTTGGGYMRIEYGCSKVGYKAVYVEYEDRFTVRCVNESDGGGPGTTPGVIGIKNAWVKLESTDGQVYKTGYTDKNGFCHFFNLPEDKQYTVEARHSYWTTYNIEWEGDNFVYVWMKSKNSRPMSTSIALLEQFPFLKLLTLQIFRYLLDI